MAAPSPTVQLATPPAPPRPPPASVEEHLQRLLEAMATTRTGREDAKLAQSFIETGLGALNAVVQGQAEDPRLKHDVEAFVKRQRSNLPKLVRPDGASPFHERSTHMGEGIHPSEEWDFYYRGVMEGMSPVVSEVLDYLVRTGVLPLQRESIARLWRQRDLRYGLRITVREENEIQRVTEEADGNVKERPDEAHSAHEERTVQDAELRSGKGWQRIPAGKPVQSAHPHA